MDRIKLTQYQNETSIGNFYHLNYIEIVSCKCNAWSYTPLTDKQIKILQFEADYMFLFNHQWDANRLKEYLVDYFPAYHAKSYMVIMHKDGVISYSTK